MVHELLFGTLFSNIILALGLVHFWFTKIRKWRNLVVVFIAQHDEMWQAFLLTKINPQTKKEQVI